MISSIRLLEMSKEAAPLSWESLGTLGKYLLMGTGGMLGGALATTGIASAERGIHNLKLRGSAFNEMLSQNPDLQAMDQEMVKKVYSVLVDFAPALAKNPTVAGNWVRSRVAMEGRIEPQDMKTIMDAQKSSRPTIGDLLLGGKSMIPVPTLSMMQGPGPKGAGEMMF